ncbi:hypothetical protein [Lactobacillus bombicola]|uniref:hypothetical protein n=1 Tax=Lactobacillus bombicola TaxID=1505723 RepID=UPI000E59032A|nr:hypothetical protein [Lactobacillus bombicola]RHW48714.1 hypothetical protein DS833_07655 [Lactobacillus bombicola]
MIKHKNKGTMRESILTPRAYKFAWSIVLISLTVILIIPWFKLFDFSLTMIGIHWMLLIDPLANFFQKHKLNGFIGIVIAFILGMIISAVLFYYVLLASGRVHFVK